MGKALILGGVRVLTGLVTATGLGFDISGISLLGISSDGLRIMIAVAFTGFVGLTIWREIELLLQPRPKVEYTALSPTAAPAICGYFVRLTFKNNSKTPLGQASTAQQLAASISIRDKNMTVIDTWDGRWANTDRPQSTGDIWKLNQIDLPANSQEVILDIGFRIEGELEFKGWDNLHYFEDKRKRIIPGSYSLQVTIGAANWKKRDLWFTLDIPNKPQSDDLNQVKVTLIKRPVIHKGGSQT